MIRWPESCQSHSTVVSERESLQQERLTRQNPFHVVFDRESHRQERLNRSSKTSCWQRDNNDQIENHSDVALTAYSSDSIMGLMSSGAAQLADLERKFLNLFRETDDACSSDNISLL